jgi:hypothetical protein
MPFIMPFIMSFDNTKTDSTTLLFTKPSAVAGMRLYLSPEDNTYLPTDLQYPCTQYDTLGASWGSIPERKP